MTARHGVPAPTPEIELSPYPYPSDPSSSSQPLLRPDGYGLGLGEQERNTNTEEIMAIRRPSKRKYWRPLLFISIPFALVFLYSVIHPHVPGLPALPRVKVHLDHGEMDSVGQDGCLCGQTDEGRRLCEVYRPEGLAKSQLVKGSGARVKRMMQKARDGERIKVGILGGSGMSQMSMSNWTILTNSIRLPWITPKSRFSTR
jgi:hypothetical protein